MTNKQLIDQVLSKNQEFNLLSLGYPVNRKHAFDIDLDLLGIKAESISNTYLNNIASPYSNPIYVVDNLKDVEVKLISLLGNHLGIKNEEEFGYVTYGGTEANFVSIWWHRNYLTKKYKTKPVLICSARSHYSLKKLSNQLDLEIIEIDSSSEKMDYDHLEEVLQKVTAPIIFSANFGATVNGIIDDVITIKELLDKYVANRYKIHGDGAIYGLFIPYLEKYKDVRIFDYIDTLSISGHKFLGAINISGVVLSTKTYLREVFVEDTKVSYLQDAMDITSSGSRQGLFSLEFYLLVKKALEHATECSHKTNLEVLWNECLANAQWFYLAIADIVGKDNKLPSYNNYQLSVIVPAPINADEKLYLGRKYGLMPVGDSQFGLYIFPRSTKSKLAIFIEDYRKLMKK